MMQIALQLLLLTTVTFLSAAPRNTGKLRILSRSNKDLRALYRTSANKGIELRSEINDKFQKISITTLDGTQLVSAKSSSTNGASVWKVMGSTIFLHSTNGGRTEYAVPPASTSRLEKEMQRDSPFSAKLLKTLDSSETKTIEIKRAAFAKLLSRPEMDDIIKMSHALGAAGIFGYENPAALNFYGLAMHYAKMQGQSTGASQPVFLPRPMKLATGKTCTRPGLIYGVYKDKCDRCYLADGYCTGMCGPVCVCWSYVCNDCCYHQGCYNHDKCCTGGWTYLNAGCAFPFPFDCNTYTCGKIEKSRKEQN